MQINEIYALFNVFSPESQGFILLKSDTIEQFLKFVPPHAIEAFKEHKALIPPISADSPEFKTWVGIAIKRLGITQLKLAEEINLDATRLSRYLSGKRKLESAEVETLRSTLKTKLITAGLLRV